MTRDSKTRKVEAAKKAKVKEREAAIDEIAPRIEQPSKNKSKNKRPFITILTPGVLQVPSDLRAGDAVEVLAVRFGWGIAWRARVAAISGRQVRFEFLDGTRIEEDQVAAFRKRDE
jgi:hypothetical protein